jgi:hypothetical protein
VDEERLELAEPWEMAQWQPPPPEPRTEAPDALELSEDRWQLLASTPQEAAPVAPEGDDAPVPVAAAWEFIQWQQPAAEPPAPAEEPVPLAQAWEYAGWQAPPVPSPETPALPDEPMPESSFEALGEPLPQEERLQPEPMEPAAAQAPTTDDGASDTSPYGLHTLSVEAARAEVEGEAAPAPTDETKEPGKS